MSKKDSQELKEQLSETSSLKEKKSPESESQAPEDLTATGSSGSSPLQRLESAVERLGNLCDDLHSELSNVAFKAAEARQYVKAVQEKVWDMYLEVSAEARRAE